MIVAFVRLRQEDCYKFVSNLHYRERIRKKKPIMSQVTQTQKDEHGIYSLISGYFL